MIRLIERLCCDWRSFQSLWQSEQAGHCCLSGPGRCHGFRLGCLSLRVKPLQIGWAYKNIINTGMYGRKQVLYPTIDETSNIDHSTSLSLPFSLPVSLPVSVPIRPPLSLSLSVSFTLPFSLPVHSLIPLSIPMQADCTGVFLQQILEYYCFKTAVPYKSQIFLNSEVFACIQLVLFSFL